jgi:hypothetical protein
MVMAIDDWRLAMAMQVPMAMAVLDSEEVLRRSWTSD